MCSKHFNNWFRVIHILIQKYTTRRSKSQSRPRNPPSDNPLRYLSSPSQHKTSSSNPKTQAISNNRIKLLLPPRKRKRNNAVDFYSIVLTLLSINHTTISLLSNLVKKITYTHEIKTISMDSKSWNIPQACDWCRMQLAICWSSINPPLALLKEFYSNNKSTFSLMTDYYSICWE